MVIVGRCKKFRRDKRVYGFIRALIRDWFEGLKHG